MKKKTKALNMSITGMLKNGKASISNTTSVIIPSSVPKSKKEITTIKRNTSTTEIKKQPSSKSSLLESVFLSNNQVPKSRKSTSVNPRNKLNQSSGSIVIPSAPQRISEEDKLKDKIKEMEERLKNLEKQYEEAKVDKLNVFEMCNKEKETWIEERNSLLEINTKLTTMIEDINKKIDIVKKNHE